MPVTDKYNREFKTLRVSLLRKCNLSCVYCTMGEDEVKENNALQHSVSANTLLQQIQQLHSALQLETVRLTGGEPLLYDLKPLTKTLQQAGFRTHLETSGAYPLSGQWNWVCLSPKKFKQPLQENFKHADELKIIVYNKNDFKWAEENAAMVSPKCKLYLQPEWSKAAEMLPLIVEYIKQNAQWELSLQMHKHLNIP